MASNLIFLDKYKLAILVRQFVGYSDLIKINTHEDHARVTVIQAVEASRISNGDFTALTLQLSYPLN